MIPRRPNRSGAPLSFAQERLFYVQQLAAGSPVYNLSTALRLEGPLDEWAMEQALNAVVARHESLRTRFIAAGGEQVVDRPGAVPVRRFEANSGSAEAAQAVARCLFLEEGARPFDLTSDLLLRAGLAKLSKTDHILLLTTHHIVSDGWSMGILLKEFGALYQGFASKNPAQLPELPVQYGDYSVWQREQMQGAAEQLEWWKRQLAGAPDVLELPTDYPRPPTQSFKGRCAVLNLPGTLVEELRVLSRREGVTLFMTLMAAFQVLMHRCTGQKDLLIGSPIAARDPVETEGLIGLFVNTLVWRGTFLKDSNFRGLLHDVREATLGALAHQTLPFERLVEALRPERSTSRSPLIQVMFALQQFPAMPLDLPGLKLTPICEEEIDTGTSKFDLTLQLLESGAGLRAVAEYSSDLFDAETIHRLLGHFRTLLEGIVADPERKTATLPLLSQAQRRRILVEWNDTQAAYPRDRTIPRLFGEQAAANPDAVAVTLQGMELTYGELDARADRLARLLQRSGVAPGTLVALCTERSLEMIIGLLGILKAGGAYVSLDPTYPRERRLFMLAEARAPVLLTQASLQAEYAECGCKVICLDLEHDSSEPAVKASAASPARANAAEDLAYVSFTSGSTGRPKGVCVPHRAVVRLVKQDRDGAFGPDDTFLQLAPVAFDASTFEIWGALLNGARLVLFPPGLPTLPELGQFIRANRISVLWLTAGLFHEMVEEQLDSLRCVRRILTGGDVLSPPHVRRALEVLAPGGLINGYGPTENTTFTCCHTIDPADLSRRSIPIGRPIANTKVYILDERLEPVPVGVPGELYAGGDGLACGYLHQPELTAEKFISNPFSSDPGARLYRTGDRVRWQPDGVIEFLGRNDRQVKIRGFRVELDEVEMALKRHPAVAQCAVAARAGHAGAKQIVAYVAGVSKASVSPQALREFLSGTLPHYMVPAVILPLAALPLNENGKMHREALPAIELTGEADDTFVPPRDQTEALLAGIWEELLGVRRVGARDSFFDLGGHSLLAMRLLGRIEKIFGKTLPIATVLARPTLEELAGVLREDTRARVSSAGSVIEIQATGSKPPLFLVHGAGGGMLWGYANLAAHLGPDQPVYSFQSRGFDGRTESGTIGEMAERYVAALRAHQPCGPYYLGGYCFGGNVAWEMARQLQAQGQHVGLLALFNSEPTRARCVRVAPTPAWLLAFIRNLSHLIAGFLGRPLREQGRLVAWQVRSLARKLLRMWPRSSARSVLHPEDYVIWRGRFPMGTWSSSAAWMTS